MRTPAPALGALLLVLLCLGCQEEKEPPNILFLFTDDQTYTAINALGNEEIHTPNLDRLVREGTTFTHAYNMGAWNGAVCLASRAMINSGRSVWRAHAASKRWSRGDTAAMARNWAPLMRRAGYATYMSGKWHVDAPAQAQFETTAHVRPGMPPDGYGFAGIQALKERHGGLPPQDSLVALLPPGYNRPLSADDASWDPTNPTFGGFWQGGTHWSEVLAADGIGFIEQAAYDDRPFFMYLAFNAPHDPRQAPAAFVNRYNPSELTVPVSFQGEYPYARDAGTGPGLRDEDLAPFPRTKLAVRKHKQEYYALITHLDAQIGKILDALEANGKADNTVIMFTADHGLAMGRHGLLGKQNLYDHSVRVPLILAGPGIPAGKRISTDVYLQDVMPTALELAGADVPEYVEFHSLLPHLEEADYTPYPAVYGAYVNYQRSIRKDGYKLIAYPGPGVLRLYNVREDPEELHDLYGAPDQEARARELFSGLRELQTELGDTLALRWEDFR